jgi:predicted metalloendopeptidase
LVADRNQHVLKSLVGDFLERFNGEAAKMTPSQRRLGQLYKVCTDVERIEDGGLSSLRPLLDGIAAADSLDALFELVAEVHLSTNTEDSGGGARPFFAWSVEVDRYQTERSLLRVAKSGTGLRSGRYVPAIIGQRDTLDAYQRQISFVLQKAKVVPRSVVTNITVDVLALEARLVLLEDLCGQR